MTDSLLLHPTVKAAVILAVTTLEREMKHRALLRAEMIDCVLTAIAEPLAALLEERAKYWQHRTYSNEVVDEVVADGCFHKASEAEDIARLLRGEGKP